MRHAVYAWSIMALSLMTVTMAFYGVNSLSSLGPEPIPQGVIEEVEMMSRFEMRLTVGEISGPIDFDRCLLVVFSPDNLEVTQVQLERDCWSYLLNESQLTLSSVVLMDEDQDSMIEMGDQISLFHPTRLDRGAWTMRLFVDDSARASVESVMVVPDMTETPHGVFRNATQLSDTEFLLTFGIMSEKVPYYYAYFEIADPNGTVAEWRTNQRVPYLFSFNDTVWLSIEDLEEKDIVNYNDLLKIESTSNDLVKGEWTITMRYVFTNEPICAQTFQVV